MIYETDPRLVDHPLGTFGCYLLSLVSKAQPTDSAEHVLKIYQHCLREEWIDHNCWVKNPREILRYLGWPAADGVAWQPTSYETKAGEIEIQEWRRPRPETRGWWTHFVTDDWDPIEGGSRTVREGQKVSLRIFRPVRPRSAGSLKLEP